MTELPSQYQPKSVEDRWYPHWGQRGYFQRSQRLRHVAVNTLPLPLTVLRWPHHQMKICHQMAYLS